MAVQVMGIQVPLEEEEETPFTEAEEADLPTFLNKLSLLLKANQRDLLAKSVRSKDTMPLTVIT